MKKISTVLALALSLALPAQAPSGRWLDMTKETTGVFYIGNGGHVIMAEDFEVIQTHEICASIIGFFSDAMQLGRYDVNFKGMRTSGTFVFTTRWDAEHWVTKWCTPQSLTQTKTIARSY